MKGEKKSKSNIDDTFEKIKESLINEKNLDEETMNKNKDKVMSLRFFSTIFAGMVAGILGFTGFLGLGFYLANFFVVTILLFLHIKKQKGNFSTSLVNLLFEGLFNHGMTYTIFWVMFYNLVYIYS
jgi:hypothetical protein